MNKKYFTYILKSKNFDKFYIGNTENLVKRVKEHNAGKTKSIKAFIPYELIYYEIFDSRTEAVLKEKYFKSGVGREYLKEKLINASVVQLDRIPDFGSGG